MNATYPLASRVNRNWLVPLLIAALHGNGIAAINIPSDGSDGALVVTQNTEIDLSLAVTGNWNDNNSANAGKGIYDPEKWAVVFKYSSVTIQGGATVTFKNHPSRAPVVWLVQGDVTVNGVLDLSGHPYEDAPLIAEPGPGGFRGGVGPYTELVEGAAGFGPGGGRRVDNYNGTGGSYGSLGAGATSSAMYGNPSVIPLIGGSGGAGVKLGYEGRRNGGGGGGGAILIATAGVLEVNGTVKANGGAGSPAVGSSAISSAAGSGGAIRLVCASLTGSGNLEAIGGNSFRAGGVGRISLWRVTTQGGVQTVPDAHVVPLTDGDTPLIWLPEDGPTVRIVSVGGTIVPPDPRAEFAAIGADVALPRVGTTTVVIETTNVEQASVVKARYSPRGGGDLVETTANVAQVVSEDPLVLRWSADVPVQDGYGAIQIKVVRP